jgi:signal transduction histidine kinase
MADEVAAPIQGDPGNTIRGVLDVARSVLSELDVDVVLRRVLEAARELTGAQYAALGVLDDDRSALKRFVTVGLTEDERAEIGPLPRGRGVLGELISHPVPLRLADVKAHPRSYGFPLGHPPMRTFLGTPVLVRGKPWGNLYLTDKAGGDEFSEADEENVVVLADFAGVAIDHARSYAGVESRRAELQVTVDALDASLEISRAVGGETDVTTILELVAKRGRSLISARSLLIELRHGNELVVAAGSGELPPGIVGRRMALADTVASAAMRSGTTQHLTDELNRARFTQYGLGRFGMNAAGGIVVPLTFRSNSYGVLVAIDRVEDGPNFGHSDQSLLESFASSAAIAVATAQAAADDRRAERLAASEAERTRWARELHDETLQGLASMRLRLELARQSDEPEALRAAIEETIDQLRSEAVSLRTLITELRPALLDQLGTQAAIEALVERAVHDGLEIDLAIDFAYGRGEVTTRHSPELETTIYRIVQEALTNARKHGHAKRAVVEITEDDYEIHITVRDDGAGFDTSEESDGFGLVGMRERAELFRGQVEVASEPGGGTTITVILPSRPVAQLDVRGAGQR